MALAACEPTKNLVQTSKSFVQNRVVKPIMGGSEAEKVPEGKIFIAEPQGVARVAEVTDRQTRQKGLLGAGFTMRDGPVQAARFSAYMQGIVDRLLAKYPGARPVRGIYIDGSDEIDASSTPDSEIWVSLGLLEALESESELAAVLAHEAGHIELDHFGSTDYFEKQRKNLTTGAGAGLLALTLADTRVSGGPGGVNAQHVESAENKQRSVYLVAGTWLINTISEGVIATWWQRKQEEQADLVAADLLPAAGFDPGGVQSLLATLGKELAQRVELGQAIARRKEALAKELAKTNPFAAAQNIPEFVVTHAVSFGSKVGKDAWTALGADHPRPQERQEAVAPYVEVRYEDPPFSADQIESDIERYKAALAAGLPERLREGHHEANKARQQLAEENLAGAGASIDKALRSSAANSAHVRSVAYLVAKAEGRRDLAYKHLLAIDKGELKPRRVFQFLAAEEADRKRWGKARAALDDGVEQFGDEEPFLQDYIVLAVAQKDEGEARRWHDKCRGVTSDAVKLACDNAIAPLQLEDLEPAKTPGFTDWLRKAGGSGADAVGSALTSSFSGAGGKPTPR